MSFQDRSWKERLRESGACRPALRWAVAFDSAQAAWEACVDPLWMVWVLQAFGDKEALTELLIKCIKHVLDMPADFREALEASRLADLCIGNPLLNKLRNYLLAWLDGDADANDVIYALGHAIHPFHRTIDVLSVPDFIRKQVPTIGEWIE